MFKYRNDVDNVILLFLCIKDIINMSKTCKFLNMLISELYSNTDIYRKIANYLYNLFDDEKFIMEIYGGFILDSLLKTRANDLDIVIHPTILDQEFSQYGAVCWAYMFEFTYKLREIINKDFGYIINKIDSYASNTIKIKLNNEVYSIDISFYCVERKLTYDFDVNSLSMFIKDFIDNGVIKEKIHTVFDKFLHPPLSTSLNMVLPTLNLQTIFKNIDNKMCISLPINHGTVILMKSDRDIRNILYSNGKDMEKHCKRYEKMCDKGITTTNWLPRLIPPRSNF